jgi:ribosomal protein S18 acetylase RimI-like enzyme
VATTVVLRGAGVADSVTIAHLHRRTALHAYAHIFPPDAPEPTLEELVAAWEERLRPGDGRQLCFVAEYDGIVVGVIGAGPDPLDPFRGHLSGLYVDPSRWACGIGSSLYERAVEHLHSRSFSTATLWVLEGNVRARGWYERRGWTATDHRRVVYAPAGIEDVLYRLGL